MKTGMINDPSRRKVRFNPRQFVTGATSLLVLTAARSAFADHGEASQQLEFDYRDG
jgi:hypothetical protein